MAIVLSHAYPLSRAVRLTWRISSTWRLGGSVQGFVQPFWTGHCARQGTSSIHGCPPCSQSPPANTSDCLLRRPPPFPPTSLAASGASGGPGAGLPSTDFCFVGGHFLVGVEWPLIFRGRAVLLHRRLEGRACRARWAQTFHVCGLPLPGHVLWGCWNTINSCWLLPAQHASAACGCTYVAGTAAASCLPSVGRPGALPVAMCTMPMMNGCHPSFCTRRTRTMCTLFQGQEPISGCAHI